MHFNSILFPYISIFLKVMLIFFLVEAISMSDRVIVFSKRPASIKNIYNINYEQRKTPMENRNSKEFNNYFNLIWRDLNE